MLQAFGQLGVQEHWFKALHVLGAVQVTIGQVPPQPLEYVAALHARGQLGVQHALL